MDPQWRRLPEDRRKRGNDEAVVRLPHAVRMRLSGDDDQRPRLVACGAVRFFEVRTAMDLDPARRDALTSYGVGPRQLFVFLILWFSAGLLFRLKSLIFLLKILF